MKFVFDFGGVVLRWRPVQLLRRTQPHLAGDEAAAAQWVGRVFQDERGDWADFDRGRIGGAALVQRIAARTGLPAADVQRVVDGVADELQPVPAAVDWLRRLHAAGHDLYYLSNMPAPLADDLEPAHDFFDCFRGGIFSSRVGLVKPEDAIFALAEQRFGASAQALVLLDDHEPNVRAAQARGWNALHFTDTARAEAVLHARGWV